MKKYLRKNITIEEKQEVWIKKNSINLSQFVQKALDKAIRKSHSLIERRKG